MHDFSEFLRSGTPPQWALLALAFITFLKFVLPWRQQSFVNEAQYRKENKELMDRVIKCERECEEHKKALHEEMFGMRKQHMQEQISFARAIIDSLPDNPQLHLLLKALENGQKSLKYIEEVEQVGGPVMGDKQHGDV